MIPDTLPLHLQHERIRVRARDLATECRARTENRQGWTQIANLCDRALTLYASDAISFENADTVLDRVARRLNADLIATHKRAARYRAQPDLDRRVALGAK